MGRFFAGLAAFISLLLAGVVLAGELGSTRDGLRRQPLAAAPGPPPVEVNAPTVSPLEVRAAVAEARGVGAAAFVLAVDAMPEIPWNEHGLARTAIDPTAIRYDEARERYVADLEDDRVAVLTLSPYIHGRLSGLLERFDEAGEAIVVIEPETGRVLAMVDDGEPNGLARDASTWAASTFKVVTGAALLMSGTANARSEVCYHGGGDGFDLSDLTFDPAVDTECRSLRTAMAYSSNIVFGRLADQHLTPESLTDVAESMGFNTRIPFEAPVARSTLELTDDRLTFAQAAAGFYRSKMSPLHGALIQAAIANDGRMMVPTLVDTIEDDEGNVVYTHTPTVWREPFSAEVAAGVTELMTDTCTSGTARRDFGNRQGWPRSIEVFGKTGTLANRDPDAGVEPDPMLLYRWFVGHAVKDGEQVAVGALAITRPDWTILGTYLASEAVLRALQ